MEDIWEAVSKIGCFRVVDFGFWVWALGFAASGLRIGVQNIHRDLGLITNMGQIYSRPTKTLLSNYKP